MMTNVESLIDQTGGCGVFQLLHVISTHLCRVIAIWGLNMMTFGNYDPGWSCVTSTGYQGDKYNSSGITAWLGEPELGNATGSSGNCSAIDTCSSLQFNPHGKTAVTEWNLVCDKAWIPSLMISLQMTGQLIGSTIAGYIGENMGRKICLYGHCLIFAVANWIAAFSVSWEMYACLRFVIGMAIGGIISTAYVYTMEFLNAKWRGMFGGMPITNTGLALFSVVVYLQRDWRWVQMTTAAIASLAFLTSFWASESMRWLTVHGKREQAKQVVGRIARYNRKPYPNTDVIDVLCEQANDAGDKEDRRYSYVDLFRHSQIRSITIRLALLWFLDVTVYFSLSFSTKALPGDFYLNLIILSSSEIPAVLCTGLMVNRFGRIKSGVAYFFLSTVACGGAALVATFDLPSEYDLAIVLLAMIAKGTLAGGRSIIRICTGELTPTSVRALGYSFHLVFSRIGAILAPFLIPGSGLALEGALTIQTALLCISSFIFLSLPESMNTAMSDLLEVEGEKQRLLDTKRSGKLKGYTTQSGRK